MANRLDRKRQSSAAGSETADAAVPADQVYSTN